MTLKDLSVDHPYYCSDSNYYSNEASQDWSTMTEFLDEMENADIDMNLVFRWDIREKRDDETDEIIDGYSAEVFIMHQRKGLFCPHSIETITENEVERFIKYLQKHKEKLDEIWKPL